MFLAQRSWILLACSHSSGVNMIFLHMLRLRLSRQSIRKHLPTGAGTVHSISRVSGPEALPTMGSGSPGKPPHAWRACVATHASLAIPVSVPKIGDGFRMMRPWDSLRDDRAHCSAPYVISFSGNNLLHYSSSIKKAETNLDVGQAAGLDGNRGSADFSAEPRLPKVWSPGVLIPFRSLGRPFPHIPTKRSKYWRNRSTTRLFISSYALLGAKRDTGGSIDTILVPSVST